MNMPFKRAKSSYVKACLQEDDDQDYQLVINDFNDYIQTGSNPALKVQAKLLRSNYYYFLGKNELDKKEYDKAATLFFLSNSDQADTLLDNCYFHLANNFIKNSEYATAMDYLSFIIDNLDNSNFLPQVLYKKMKIQFEIDNLPGKSYLTYQIIKNKFPANQSTNSARKVVNEYMPAFIEQAKSIWRNGNYSQSIDELLSYLQYPADYQGEITSTIGDVYFSWGNNLIKENQLVDAEEKLYKAKSYKPNLNNAIHEKLEEICTIYIKKGDMLLTERKIDEAINSYQSPLKIFDEYPTSISKIEQAQQIKSNIEKADKLVREGSNSFVDEKYQQALHKYRQAYEFDHTETILQKILLAKRWIRITEDPKSFARDIIQNYQDGLLIKEIKHIENEAKSIYSLSEITISPWLVMRSTARNSYEVRLTITTPNESHIFFWVVKLETGKIIPLNTSTEEMMKQKKGIE
ncbi:MAG: hypothetical protein U9P79_08660 [Candidatus Cloacimonadota bacterium]|nr:hypothetical protein [Candidatus Cloacimonadota bacterium]